MDINLVSRFQVGPQRKKGVFNSLLCRFFIHKTDYIFLCKSIAFKHPDNQWDIPVTMYPAPAGSFRIAAYSYYNSIIRRSSLSCLNCTIIQERQYGR